MRRPPTLRAFWIAAAIVVAVSVSAAGESGLIARALELLEDDAAETGPLELRPVVRLSERPASRPDLIEATLELHLPGSLPPAAARLELVIALASFELEPRTLSLSEELTPALGGELRMRVLFEAPEEVDRVVVAAALAGADSWGVAEAELADVQPIEPETDRSVIVRDLRAVAAGAEPPPVLRLLPPMSQPVTGRTRVRVLISDVRVDRVHFELDGEPVAEDDAAPFAAIVDFGTDVGSRDLRALAYDAAGRLLGEDLITVNQETGGTRVRILELRPGDGAVTVTAALDTAGAPTVEQVEFYLNERLAASLTRPPWRAELPRPEPQVTDFVRVVARLADGTAIEDARLVQAAAERVEVNLVQVFAVVTDREGVPKRDLTRDDFELRLGGRAQTIDRFAAAEEVPLVLGLVIDTSGSMWTLMPDTRQAGSRFLVQTLRPGDRAFLVDFDTRPRLAAELTDDLGGLLRRFAGLTAEGFTALYDAVIFSMLQFENTRGRKALVVLTDGDDYKSRFGARRCIEYGRELGVPVYIIALGGLFGERRDLRKLDLESLAGSTGGRVFYIGGSHELAPAYDQIQQELRSQYLLAFATPEPLSTEELGKIRVEVRPRGLRVRSVAGVAQP